MTMATLRKAARMPVVRAADGSYRVGGDSDVYKVFRSFIAGGWACECAARSNRCSHIVAVELATDRKDKK